MRKSTFIIVMTIIFVFNIGIAYMVYNKQQFKKTVIETPKIELPVVTPAIPKPVIVEKPTISKPVIIPLPYKKPVMLKKKKTKKTAHKKRRTRKIKVKEYKPETYPKWAKEAFERAEDR